MRALVRVLAAFAVIGTGSLLSNALQKPPFAGYLQLELVSDSFSETCRLKLVVDQAGKGSSEVECRSAGVLAVTKPSRGTLQPKEVDDLRRLLREADLFQGQSWGDDARGLDLSLVTLVVSDGSRAAALVCFRNASFEKGARERLLASLQSRLYAGRPGAK
jgi:hypothetical protein